LKTKNIYLTYILFFASLACLHAQHTFYDSLSAAAITLTKDAVQYDPSYFRIAYPNGDVPLGKGVCTDVVIRAYRKLGIDLQKEVHEDMKNNFGMYPKNWNMKRCDTNIDHRRVPNLMKFFSRKGKVLKTTMLASDYSPGDIVTWDLGHGITHIGIVVNQNTAGRFFIVHNIGNGQEISDCLFSWKVTGHYRFSK
jgi:uncharacterized protein YijF (DUF1287 family)